MSSEKKKYKLKKNVASKFAKNKGVQKVITKYLGPEGQVIIQILSEFFLQYKNKKVSKEWKNNVFKFSLKAALMFENNKITREDAFPLKVPLENYAISILTVLSHESYSQETSNDIKKFLDLQTKLKQLILELMKPNMQEKNTDLLDKTITSLDSNFFKFMFSDSKHLTNIKLLHKSITSLLEAANIFPNSNRVKIVSQSTFCDQYSSSIACIRTIWAEVDKSNEEFGRKILENFYKLDDNYREAILSSKFGTDTKKHSMLILEFIDCIIRMLGYWPNLCEKLKKISKESSEWVTNIDTKKGYDDFGKALITTLSLEKKKFTSMSRKHFEKIIGEVVKVLKCDS